MEIKTKNERFKDYMEKIKDFTIMDDTFMVACFRNQPKLIEYVLQIIMDKPAIEVKEVTVQSPLKHIQGRSLTLDIEAIDAAKKRYDSEFQQASSGAKPKRARYHSSMMDADILEVGEDFEKLPETYVIFITKYDVLGMNLPLYNIGRVIINSDKHDIFDDKSHILYVNASIQNNTELGKLMYDFQCANPQMMFNQELADRVQYLKETKEGRNDMCEIMDKFVQDEKTKIALNLLAMTRLSIDEISKVTELSVEKVKELCEQNQLVTV